MWTLLAETPSADVISLSIQLVLQAGALGVLILLAVQAPKIMRVLREWRVQTEKLHRDERDLMREEHKEALAQQRLEHRESLETIVRQCDEAHRRRDQDMVTLQSEIENLQELVERRRRRPRPPTPPQT
jgi:uncharacterized protein HemX